MKLVAPLEIDESEFNTFIEEFKVAGEELVPYSLNQKGLDFDSYVTALMDEALGKGIPEGWVPASTYFMTNDKRKIYGAVNIRSRLTENLKIEGGHIGYGIRPSARLQGHGSKILALALEKARAMGITEALVTCDKENIGSARVIQNNGGIFDSETEKNRVLFQRYWITL